MARLHMRHMRQIIPRVSAAACLVGAACIAAADEPIRFNRDIRPIFSDICFACHGPDEKERQTSWRLDQPDAALARLEDGGFAIVPGKSAESVMYQRLTSADPDVRMPPPDYDKQLTDEQIELIRRWIDAGANFQQHWSFVAPVRPELPAVKDAAWPITPVDYFILAGLEQAGLSPEPEAGREALIRRVTLDLTGLPPTIAEIDAFLADTSPGAYERLVDRLLKSPRYGEHRTRYWLDAARYGDTHGLHLDNERSLWPYRDWVLQAFNDNMPFDRFTIEQLAGDLLPDPTRDQLVATGFSRCNVTTSEGGSIPEEYRVRYAVDRVETLGTVFLGLTIGCAVCHEHKFDPISQKEFYQLFAYYNNVDENPMDGNALLPPPVMKVPSPAQANTQQQLQAQIAAAEQQIRAELARIEYTDPNTASLEASSRREFVWFDDALPAGARPESSGGQNGWQWVGPPDHPVVSGQQASTRTGQGTTQHFFTGAKQTLRIGSGDVLFAYVHLDPGNPPQEIMLQFNDGTWEHRAYWGENLIEFGQSDAPSRVPLGPLPKAGEWVRLEVPAEKVGLKPGAVLNGWAFTQFGGTVYWDKAGIVTETPQDAETFESLAVWLQVQQLTGGTALPQPLQGILKVQPAQRSPEQQRQLRDYFLEHACTATRPVFETLHKQLAGAKAGLEQLDKEIPGTMIMKELPQPRECYVLTRGEYDKPDKSQPVQPGVPAVFPSLPAGAPPNRLGLAQWLVDPGHPLTARVTVNRFWQQYFGTGLVKTSEDFGSQGEWPSHPELLDWLAREFIGTGWDVKRLHKMIVMSAAYRQSSRITPQKLARDPQNRLISRGPRFRMDAEMLRDQALHVSGLLVEQLGGKSVRPYQPPGIWEAVGYTTSNTARFAPDSGEKLYRRSLYTFWKRTAPPPSMQTFDAPSRESCTVLRARTNTPLQALALMNDVQYVEAARKFAERVLKSAGPTVEERLALAFRAATARPPRADELAVLRGVLETHLAEYRGNPEAAGKLLAVGEAPRDAALDAAELAAWTMVANLILNLDETVTKG